MGKEKHEKLGGVVRKIFSRAGTIAEDGLTHPFDETTKLTKGFAFVNFLTPQDAKQTVATFNGWQLDKSHNIKVNAILVHNTPTCVIMVDRSGSDSASSTESVFFRYLLIARLMRQGLLVGFNRSISL